MARDTAKGKVSQRKFLDLSIEDLAKAREYAELSVKIGDVYLFAKEEASKILKSLLDYTNA